MKIEKVVRKDEKNVIIFFDNNEKLILTEETFFNSGLRKGDIISEDRYDFFIEQNKIYHIKQKAITYLARRSHSEKELYVKLKLKGYEEKLINSVLNHLKELGVIDDQKFALEFAEEKWTKKHWGKNKIHSALIIKGVQSQIIKDVLKSFKSGENEFNVLTGIANKKLVQLKKRVNDDKKLYQKLITFLTGRGYDYEMSKEVCRKLLNPTDDYES